VTGKPIFDPDLLGQCISCGFCLPACPTYRLTGDEASSPRGRIALMRAIDTGTVDVLDAAARHQGSFCLGCRACEPVCPAGVTYGNLLEQLRDAQWTGRHRPVRIRPLLRFAASPRVIRLVGRLRRHAKPTTAGPTGDTLLLGCFERTMFPAVSRAAADTLPNLHVTRRQGCCGALHAHNGQSATGTAMARRLGADDGRIITTSGGCAAHLASVIGRHRVVDYAEAVLESPPTLQPLMINGRVARVGLQDSCHLRNGLGGFPAPRQLLTMISEYVEIPGAGDCCGAAGTYSILRKHDSRRVLADKIAALARLDLDILAVVNPGCQRQLITAVRRARLPIRVMHLAQLVEQATIRTDREQHRTSRR
jgi:glycolate oxidase iron-sulfur subunit